MVEVELAIARLVALTADIVESVKERQQVVEVLESLKFRSRDRAVGWLRHEISPPEWQPLCLAESIAQILCRTDVVSDLSSVTLTPAVLAYLARVGPTTPTRAPGLPLALWRLDRFSCCRTWLAAE